MDHITTASALSSTARAAASSAYAPYSRFRVGAAVEAGGKIYTGCNVENASYGLAICAERVAIFAAIADGARSIEAIAVACIDAPPDSPAGGLMPCGACRQVMAEFAEGRTPVYVHGVGVFTLSQLLPSAFTLPSSDH